MILNKGQERARRECVYWYNNPAERSRPYFEISGPAGTGKTTVVRSIIDSLGLDDDEVIFMAYVGKAALALRLSGVNGRTVHSVIYVTMRIPLTDDKGRTIYVGGKPQYKSIFVKVNELPPKTKLLVIDEGGMVPGPMAIDILSFNVPTIVLGDLHQLPPVMGNSYFLLKPDAFLDEIMRQAKDSPIIYLSQLAMHGIDIPYGSHGNGEVRVIHPHELEDNDLAKNELIICGTNKMRDTINWYTRKHIYGIEGDSLQLGDKIICRKNCWDIMLTEDIALVNGMVGYVTGINRDTSKPSIMMEIEFRPEFTEKTFKDLPIYHKYIFMEYAKRQAINTRFREDIPFEFGYCLTCHLSQGSQSDNVLVYNDIFGGGSDYYKKWLYTAVTRAKKGLTVVI